MNKVNDILPLDSPSSYYFSAGTIAYIDPFKAVIIQDIPEGNFTIPTSFFSERDLSSARKSLAEALPNAMEEWYIDGGDRMGLFRFAEAKQKK
jgi:hypothetical protein